MADARVAVEVAGRRLSLSNLDKPLWPDGTTKGRLVEHAAAVAEVQLPHLRGRPLTLHRFPDGAARPGFFAKNVPAGTPDWVRRVRLPAPGSTKGREEITYVVAEEPATLVWAANLGALELHTPMWRVDADGRALGPDLLVLDLDPGAPATVVQCCAVALRAADVLRDGGLDPVVKTSGGKGLQVYAAVPGGDTRALAHALALRLEAETPDLVVSRMTKVLRDGKVLVDWSQNSPAKTTASVYSTRARPRPTVSCPMTWDEVAACRDPEDLVVTLPDLPARLERHGDLFAPLLRPSA